MGYYINPTDMTKEEYLEKNGKEISMMEFQGTIYQELRNSGAYGVVLIQNSLFSAAMICYCEKEHKYPFEYPDPRPKRFFILDEKYINQFLPERVR